MIFAFDGLPETPLAEKVNNLKSKGEMVPENDSVVALVVIKTIVTCLPRFSLNFLDTRQPYEIHSLVLKQLSFFKISQLATTGVLFEALTNAHREWQKLWDHHRLLDLVLDFLKRWTVSLVVGLWVVVFRFTLVHRPYLGYLQVLRY